MARIKGTLGLFPISLIDYQQRVREIRFKKIPSVIGIVVRKIFTFCP